MMRCLFVLGLLCLSFVLACGASRIRIVQDGQADDSGYRKIVRLLKRYFDRQCEIQSIGEQTKVDCYVPGSTAALSADGTVSPVPQSLYFCASGVCSNIAFVEGDGLGNIAKVKELTQKSMATDNGSEDTVINALSTFELIMQMLNSHFVDEGSCDTDVFNSAIYYITCSKPAMTVEFTADASGGDPEPKHINICNHGGDTEECEGLDLIPGTDYLYTVEEKLNAVANGGY